MSCDPRHTSEWRKVRQHVLRGASVCHVPGCRYPHESLRHDAPRGHPLKATVDHVFPVEESRGWDDRARIEALFNPRYLRPAHWACNSDRHNAPHRLHEVDRRVGDWGV